MFLWLAKLALRPAHTGESELAAEAFPCSMGKFSIEAGLLSVANCSHWCNCGTHS